MNLRNVIILGELDYVLATSFESPTTKAKCLAYDSEVLPMERNENGATNVNCLYVLNEVLDRIAELKEEMNGFLPEACYIAIPKRLYTLIQQGAYKNWIKKDGYANTGTKFDDREIDEWSRFSTLYGMLFADVSLRDATYYEMSKPKFDIANMNKHKHLIKNMKMKIQEHKEEALEQILV